MKHLSLCSGIGGLDLAAEWAGFETAAQCEIDKYASKVLAKNFPGVPNLHDIRTVTNGRLADFGISPADRIPQRGKVTEHPAEIPLISSCE